MQQHARAIAKETMEKTLSKAQQFDNQTALQRKMNEASRLAKSQAHIRDETPETLEGVDASTKPLVDRKCVYSNSGDLVLTALNLISGFG